MKRPLILAATLAAAVPAWGADLTYHVKPEKDAPEEQVARFEADEIVVRLNKEPVARVPSSAVKEARIVAEPFEPLDDESDATEMYRVTLILDDAEREKLAATMRDLCPKAQGVHAVFDGEVIDYRLFVVCDRFDVVFAFQEREKAEDFARKISPRNVVLVTPAPAPAAE